MATATDVNGKKAISTYGILKRRRRSKPEGRIYDRARNRALVKLAQKYTDDYQVLLQKEMASERRRVRREQKKLSTTSSG